MAEDDQLLLSNSVTLLIIEICYYTVTEKH